jgi:hypothetical protein
MGQAGEALTAHFCGDERGINDRGVYVPDGLRREEIALVGKLLEDEFDTSKCILGDMSLEKFSWS